MRENPTLTREAERLAVRLIDRAAERELQRRNGSAAVGRSALLAPLLVIGPVLCTGPAALVAGVVLVLSGGFGQVVGGVVLLLLGLLSHPGANRSPSLWCGSTSTGRPTRSP